MTNKEIITSRQRYVQAEKLLKAMALLKVAVAETNTATPNEISQTVDIALEIVSAISAFSNSDGTAIGFHSTLNLASSRIPNVWGPRRTSVRNASWI